MKFKELREKIEPVNIGKEITPPAMLVLKRRGIRVFPSGQRVALYSNDHYGLMFTVPYGASGLGMSAQSPLMGVKEEVEQVDEFHSVLGGLGDAIARKVSAKTYRALKRRHFKKPASGAPPAAPKGRRSP